MKKIYKIIFVLIFCIVVGCSSVFAYNFQIKKKNISFSILNEKKIKKARTLLNDDKSKEIFDATINFRDDATKENEIPSSDYPQYFHPQIQLKEGDIIIDGGVYNELYQMVSFSATVGETGLIIGFEPDPRCYNSIMKKIQDSGIKNIEIQELGLWNKDAELKFYLSDNGDSTFSSKIHKNKSTILCKLTSVDNFMKKNNITNVNLIKLDIEGSEMQALKGSKKTIKKYRPQLAIAAYHFPTDIFEIILFIDSLNLGYKFYMGHHADNSYLETVLYAIQE